MIYIAGPGHCGHAMIAGAYLDGTYSEVYPSVSLDKEGLARLFRQFSFPRGVPSHVAPETPGSIHEGGELGYSLLHATGAALDNPDLVVAAIVSDGEFQTGPLAASWHSNKFLDPTRDGAVLPILHLNGYKIALPTVPARLEPGELDELLHGAGWAPITVAGHGQAHAPADGGRPGPRRRRDPLHPGAVALGRDEGRPRWPMVVLASPAGWTAPKTIDGMPAEGTWRCHLTPLEHPRSDPGQLAQLEAWLRSYRPEELFDESGAPLPEIRALAPRGAARMSAALTPRAAPSPATWCSPTSSPTPSPSPHRGVSTPRPPGSSRRGCATCWWRTLTGFGSSVPTNVLQPPEPPLRGHRPRVHGEIRPTDEALSPHGRVMDVLSEHLCQGWRATCSPGVTASSTPTRRSPT